MPNYRVPQVFVKTGIIIFVMVVMWSCSFFGDRKKGQYIPVSFDLSKEVGPFEGLGVNVPISFYSRRMKALQSFNELGIKYIRVKREDENWNDILALRSSTSRLGIKWIYSLDAIPINYIDDSGRLVDVEGFAGWWAEEVDELLYQDVPADFIELLDAPDTSSTDSLSLTPDTYNALLHATRKELDLRNFQDVAIIGPGLSNPGITGDMETWYMNLDQQAFEFVSNWTVHMWEDRIPGEHLDPALGDLLNYLEETESTKPLFVNSYASSETNFNGVTYPDPDEYDVLGNLSTYKTYYYSATFTMPYALRVYSNTLDMLHHKQVIPFLYQLYDAPADVKYKKRSWGLLDLNGGEKPVFTLLSNLLKRVPKNSTVVRPVLSDASLNGIIFKDRTDIVLTLSNTSTEKKFIQVNLGGSSRPLEFVSGVSCHSPEILLPEHGQRDEVEILEEQVKLRLDDENDATVFSLQLKPQSIFIGEFQYK